MTTQQAGMKFPVICTAFPDTFFYAERLKAYKTVFGKNKFMPPVFEKQILLALSFFPELRDSKITFVCQKATSPLSCRPTWASVFRNRKKRTYQITISIQTNPKLTAIMFANLPFNAQIGVLGHELSHIVDYQHRGFWGLFAIGLGQFFSPFLDRFEFQTDRLCIEHGLGYQLKAWSEYVRQTLNIERWRGSGGNPKKLKERYMNPNTIQHHIDQIDLYKEKIEIF